SSLAARESIELSGCTSAAMPPAVTTTNQFVAHDAGNRSTLIRLLTSRALNPSVSHPTPTPRYRREDGPRRRPKAQRQVEGKRTRTDLTIDVVTKDGWNVRVKPMAITDRRIQTAKQRVIRTIMTKTVGDVASKQSIGEFVKGIISGDLAKTIALACKPIHPVSRVEVRKSEVWAMGELPPPSETPGAETPAAETPAAPELPVEEEPSPEPEPEKPE